VRRRFHEPLKAAGAHAPLVDGWWLDGEHQRAQDVVGHPGPGVAGSWRRRVPAYDAALSTRRDVQRIRSSPYLPAGLPVVGAVYDVRTGLIDVAVPADGA
jgi:hypothetical protein